MHGFAIWYSVLWWLPGAGLAADLPTLRSLPAMPRDVYWVERNNEPQYSFWLTTSDDYQLEITRLTRTACARLEGLTAPVAQKMLAVAALANAKLCLNLSPWFEDTGNACVLTPVTTAYLAKLESQCAAAKALLGTRAVSRVVIDFEPPWRPTVQVTDVIYSQLPCHDIGLLWRHVFVAACLKKHFPDAVQTWYQAGQIDGDHDSDWSPRSYGAEMLSPRPAVAPTLYQIDRVDLMLDKLRRNIVRAGQLGVACTPFVTLGATYKTGYYQRQSDGRWLPGSPAGSYAPAVIEGWKYYWLARELLVYPENPENRGLDAIILYPGPGDPRWPDWDRAFVHFVMGAARTTPIPESYQRDPVSADFDGDGDVDMDDFGVFQRQATGATR